MRFYTRRHQYTCGIDLHARSMYLWVLDAQGQDVFAADLPTSPAALLDAVAPYRDDLVIAVECMFAWYWVADLCREQGIHFVLGHALYMKAIHGAKHKNDKIDAQKIARLTYGGNLPVAYAYPPQMRSTRDLMRRRGFFVRQRAHLLTHLQTTCQQYNLPPFNKRIAYKANRAGVPKHFSTLDASVQDMVAADLAMIDHLDSQVRRIELAIVRRAKAHDPAVFYRLRSIRRVGKVLALTMLYEIHDIGRFEQVQDFLSYARLVRSKKTSGGKPAGGTSGRKIGNAHLKWAFSEATILLMRESDHAKTFVERKAKRFGKAKAISVLSAKIGRAVYHMLATGEPFDEQRFFATT
jgi:transposase